MNDDTPRTLESLLESHIDATTRHSHATRSIATLLIGLTVTSALVALVFVLGVAFGQVGSGTAFMVIGALGAIAGLVYTIAASLGELARSRSR